MHVQFDPSSMLPPWRVFPGLHAEEFGRTVTQGSAEAWFTQVWQPFWNSLDRTQRAAYLAHWQASDPWQRELAPGREAESFDIAADAAESDVALAGIRAPSGKRGCWVFRRICRKA